MPLGFFSTASSSQKQPLGSSNSGNGSKEKKDRKEGNEKDARGAVVKLNKGSVTIERKLAEGGFAIVYLCTDRSNRQFALKRQFISDDLKQIEACTREYKIISELRGHKNIVCYVDHLLAQNKDGIWDYMLLTVYYKTSVLQLMNERLANGKGLSPKEVLSIFCDMCEAVARLHHSKIPIIHRDLKVENILVDERNRAAPPIYVLCDFGSATTKVLSLESHGARYIQDEIERYTTLSYRSPEMVDIYGGRPIGAKSDTWALGVMLFKLCYFSLPFGESAMAIQNGAFSFPSQPEYPDSIRAIIKCLLEADIDRRPSIYSCSQLAFQAAEVPCPVNNLHNNPTPKLSQVVDAFKRGAPINVPTTKDPSPESSSAPSEPCLIPQNQSESSLQTTTSVNPRLRPKPVNSVPSVPGVVHSPKLLRPAPLSTTDNSKSEPEIVHSGATLTADLPNDSADPTASVSDAPLSCPLFKPTDLGFTDLEEAKERERSQTDAAALRKKETAAGDQMVMSTRSAHNEEGIARMTHNEGEFQEQQHRQNAVDNSQLARSAFKPYSQTATSAFSNRAATSNDAGFTTSADGSAKNAHESAWNPFKTAPFSNEGVSKSFGVQDEEADSDSLSIDSRDPFGAAPFDLPASFSGRQALPKSPLVSSSSSRPSHSSTLPPHLPLRRPDASLRHQFPPSSPQPGRPSERSSRKSRQAEQNEIGQRKRSRSVLDRLRGLKLMEKLGGGQPHDSSGGEHRQEQQGSQPVPVPPHRTQSLWRAFD
ncbi:hypothetical protein WR25_00905 [Diploscapter pachys]|uniref:non-specific serine/threonine protein kinase n=1 Tax=Diploscapter pachys TaxID=2018661 RepID=A0A2A2KVJ4_9BILA|nr:hypothetical protein WR25_00905 [Diploscapter pachys]